MALGESATCPLGQESRPGESVINPSAYHEAHAEDQTRRLYRLMIARVLIRQWRAERAEPAAGSGQPQGVQGQPLGRTTAAAPGGGDVGRDAGAAADLTEGTLSAEAPEPDFPTPSTRDAGAGTLSGRPAPFSPDVMQPMPTGPRGWAELGDLLSERLLSRWARVGAAAFGGAAPAMHEWRDTWDWSKVAHTWRLVIDKLAELTIQVHGLARDRAERRRRDADESAGFEGGSPLTTRTRAHDVDDLQLRALEDMEDILRRSMPGAPPPAAPPPPLAEQGSLRPFPPGPLESASEAAPARLHFLSAPRAPFEVVDLTGADAALSPSIAGHAGPTARTIRSPAWGYGPALPI